MDAGELRALDAAELAAVLEPGPGARADGAVRALAAATSGRTSPSTTAARFAAVVDARRRLGGALAETLGGWRCFADVSPYDGAPCPFLKRAQIAAADLHRAGVADFADLDRLTMFADNLVPHVLRLDGVLRFDPALVARIERGS